MQRNIYLPNVELNMEGVTVTAWLVNVGGHVETEQPLLEVETQKATIEVPSPEAGYVRAIFASPGEAVAERALLCILTDEADEPFNDPSNDGAKPDEPHQAVQRAVNDGAVAPSAPNEGIAPAVPAARKLAKELGVDLARVVGSGPGGRIMVADVQQAISADGDGWQQLPASRVALNGQMQKSLAEIPQIHIARRMNVTALTRKQEGITFTHRLILLVAASLKQHPALRTIIEGERIKVEPVSVAIAMDTPHGLLAPALRNADTLSLTEISSTVKAFAERGAANSLKRQELTNAPFAITNLGMLGVDSFQPFVFHGQTAVLAIGQAVDDGGGKVAWFNLAADHRIVDGVEAARFLQTLQREIEAL